MRTKTRIPSFSHYLSFISRTGRRIPPLKIGFIIDSMTFKYRRAITITEQSGSDLTDYQVLIELNSSNFDFSHAQTNGEDIRFTDDDGNLLDYWIEEWDAVNEKAKIWVKVPSIPANSSVEIYCYYGNSEITSASDADATFIRVIDGVVGSWHFDEGSGLTAYDTSGNDNDGTLVNGPTWVDGKFGTALDFDREERNYVNMGDILDYITEGSFTLESWIKADTSQYIDAFIISKSENGNAFSLSLYSYHYGRVRYVRSGTSWGVTGNKDVVDGQWHHLIYLADRDRNALSLYVDGMLDKERTDWTAGSIDVDEPLTIGIKNTGESYPYNGVIDEVRIYNRALTAQEISDLYNNYGYTTENYPGKVLVRKYSSPEPSVSLGVEET